MSTYWCPYPQPSRRDGRCPMHLPDVPSHETSTDHARTTDMLFEEHLNSAHPGWTLETLKALRDYWNTGTKAVRRVLNEGKYVGPRNTVHPEARFHRHEWDRSQADAGLELWCCARDGCRRTVLVAVDPRVMNEAGGVPQGTVERKLIVP